MQASSQPRLHWRQFAIHIASPALLTFALFLLLIFAFVVPAMKRSNIDRKKETIRELTQTAWSDLAALHEREMRGEISRADAQEMARTRVRALRYGDEGKDYFWISDMHPRMVMHPYRPELDGQDLTDHYDRTGKRMFVEFRQVVQESGAGYVEYFWQWKDDAERIVPKLSYVKGFEPWGWVIGTGIYLEDVRERVWLLAQQVIWVSLGISVVIAGLLGYIAKQGLDIERRRWLTEGALRASEAKYRALVEGTRVGIMMALRGRLVFANRTALGALGLAAGEVEGRLLPEIVDPVPELPPGGEGDGVLKELPAKLLAKDGGRPDVLLTASPVRIGGQEGMILSFKDRTVHRRTEEVMASLLEELQTTQTLPMRPVADSDLAVVSCDLDTPVSRAAALMSRARSSAILVRTPAGEAVGILTDADLRRRVLAEGRGGSVPVSAVMSAPLQKIAGDALLFEAVREMHERGIKHLVVTDGAGGALGVLSAGELLRAQRHSVSALMDRIARAESREELRECLGQVPLFIQTLLEGGTRVERVTRMMAAVSDAILARLIAQAMEKLGRPPAAFTFVVLGSAARGEQTLATDQDNALIFEDVEPGRLPEVQAYFQELGGTVCGWLDEVGYRRCGGDVMASNPKWCQPLSRWRAYFSEWVQACGPQELRDVNVFFDFRRAHGDPGLDAALRAHLRDVLGTGRPAFFFHLAKSALQFNPPIGFFGNIQVETAAGHPQAFDIKGAIIPIVNFARVYALRNRVEETGTLERLRRLLDAGVLTRPSHDELAQAYSALMHMRLTHQIARIKGGAEPDNFIDLGEITRLERSMLRKVFADLGVFQQRLRADFVRGE